MRAIAYKVRFLDLLEGKFCSGNREEFKPAHVLTRHGLRVARLNTVARVLEHAENHLLLDDGSAKLKARIFPYSLQLATELKEGDWVLILAKPRQFEGELYLQVEVLRKVDEKFQKLRELESLEHRLRQDQCLNELKALAQGLSREEVVEVAKRYGMDEEALDFVLQGEADRKQTLLQLIQALDQGQGVEISKLFEASQLSSQVVERTLGELLASGEVYEPYPGIVKAVRA